MTDNEVLSSHSGEQRRILHNSSPNHANNSSQSISLGDTPDSRIEEDEEASNEAKGHSADDEGTYFFSLKKNIFDTVHE